MRNEYSYPEPDGVENRVAEQAAAYESEGLPYRLLNAREVAKFVGSVAHTGADCSDRNASVSEEGGFIRTTSSTGFVEEHQRKSRNRKEDPYGCSKAVSQQRLQDEPALRASVVAGCHAQLSTLPNARR